MKTFVLGDPHGSYQAMLQVFERSKFDYNTDKLIVLGDVCDGWPEVYEAIEELLKVKNLVYIIGNHDRWTLDWALYGDRPEIWTSQGGQNTLESYNKHGGIPESHVQLLKTALGKYVEDNRLFVHGGIDPNIPLNDNDIKTLTWDRELMRIARMKGNKRPDYRLTDFTDIFIGHTTTEMYHTFEPMHCCEVWNIDTGAGWSGKLTIMDLDTKEYWQSDFVYELYPDVKGRR